MGHSYDGTEHRKYLRVSKTYSLFFSFKDFPERKSDETFIKDIGKGGLRFTNSFSIKPGSFLIFEIAIPYIAPKRLILEGLVVASKEINPGLVYEIRAKFIAVDDQTLRLFDMIEKQNIKDHKTYGLH